MSLKIRLTRVGAKKQASYRIVVADSRSPRDGKAIAILGHYNPLTDPYTLKVDPEKTVSWLRNGATPTDTARGLLAKAGVMAAYEKVRKPQPSGQKTSTAEAKAARPAKPPRAGTRRLVRPGEKPGSAEAKAPIVRRESAAEPKAAKPAATRAPAKKAAAKPAVKAASKKAGTSKGAAATAKSTSAAKGGKAKK